MGDLKIYGTAIAIMETVWKFVIGVNVFHGNRI